jgi:hypothetical protein
LADGTFRSAPSDFLQIYTIHGIYFENRAPLVYSFMKGKNENSYNVLFHCILENIQGGAETLITDFELAPVNVFAGICVNSDVAGC